MSNQHASQFILLALIFLTCKFQSVSCDTYYILTSAANTCPEGFTWEQCITLQRFANTFQSQSQNVLLILEGGTHPLTSEISLSNRQNFTMVPATTATSRPRIACDSGNVPNNDFSLTSVSHMQVQGVTLDGCYVTIGSSSLGVVGNSVLISDVLFDGSVLYIYNILDSVQLMRVNFTDSTQFSNIENFINSTRVQMSHVTITRLNGVQVTKAAQITVTDVIVQETGGEYTESLVLLNSPDVSVTRGLFINNHAGENNLGGGLFLWDVTATVSDSTFYNNHALAGSGLAARTSNLTVNNCTFTANSALHYGSIDSEGGNLTVTNSVFVSNIAVYGAAVTALSVDMLYISNCSFIENNKQAIFTRLGGNISITSSVFRSNIGGGTYGGGAIATDRTRKLSVTDCFFNSNAVTASDEKGGAINMKDGNLLTLTGCSFVHNSASNEGGAVYTTGSLIASRTNFTNNTATNSGGAVNTYSLIGYGVLTISHCNLIGNRAASASGGAIHVDSGNSAIYIDNSHFARNTAEFGTGGAIHQEGEYTNISLVDSTFDRNSALSCGVVDIDDVQHRRVEFTRSTFTSNVATGTGTSDGGGVLCVNIASISMTDCTFNNNLAQHGGILNVDDSNVKMNRCFFIQNSASRMGGVAYTNVNPVTYSVRLSTFLSNSAGVDGGAIYLGIIRSRMTIEKSSFGSNSAQNRGGMAAINGSQLVIDNQTNIYDNTASRGPAISACTNSQIVTSSQLTLTETDSGCNFYSANINSFNISEFIQEELSTTTAAPEITTTKASPLTTSTSPTTQEPAGTSHMPYSNHSIPPTITIETEEPPETDSPRNTLPWNRPSTRSPTPPIGTVSVPLSDPSTHYGKIALSVSIVSLVLTLALFVLVGVYLVMKIVAMATRHKSFSKRGGSSTELLMEDKT